MTAPASVRNEQAADTAPGRRQDSEQERRQIHLRLLPRDEALLRSLAERRGQTLSGAVSYLLRKDAHPRDR